MGDFNVARFFMQAVNLIIAIVIPVSVIWVVVKINSIDRSLKEIAHKMDKQ